MTGVGDIWKFLPFITYTGKQQNKNTLIMSRCSCKQMLNFLNILAAKNPPSKTIKKNAVPVFWVFLIILNVLGGIMNFIPGSQDNKTLFVFLSMLTFT